MANNSVHKKNLQKRLKKKLIKKEEELNGQMIIKNFSWDVRYYFSTVNCFQWFCFHNLVLNLLRKNLNNFVGTNKYKGRHKLHLKKNLKFHFFKVQMRNLRRKIQKIKILRERIFFFSFKTIET